MGVVYLAGDGHGRLVAVKVVRAAHTRREGFAERFRAEVASARRVSSFCTSRVLDDGVAADGRPYLVTEYIPGVSLDERIRRSGRLDPADLHGMAFGVAAALAAIHAAGVVHLDLKPANVILSPSGPRVIDFGVARALDDPADDAELVGTPGWWAPEQVSGGEVTPAADVFAWGCLVAYAGSGQHPFGEGDPETMAERVRHGEPALGPLPPPLDRLVRQAMRRDPALRPTARELLLRLVDPGDRADPVPRPLLGRLEKFTVPDPGERRNGNGAAENHRIRSNGATGGAGGRQAGAVAGANAERPGAPEVAATVSPTPPSPGSLPAPGHQAAPGGLNAPGGRTRPAVPEAEPRAEQPPTGTGRRLRAARTALVATLTISFALMVVLQLGHRERGRTLDVLDKPARVSDIGRRIPLAGSYHGPQLVVQEPNCGYPNHRGGVLNPDRQTCRVHLTMVNMGSDAAPLSGELPILIDDLGKRHRPYFTGRIPATIEPGARLMFTVRYAMANSAFPRTLVGRFVRGGELIRIRL